MQKLCIQLFLVDVLVDHEAYRAAIAILEYSIRSKMDGSLTPGFRLDDLDDWIIDKQAQRDLCLMIDDVIAYLRTFGLGLRQREATGASFQHWKDAPLSFRPSQFCRPDLYGCVAKPAQQAVLYARVSSKEQEKEVHNRVWALDLLRLS